MGESTPAFSVVVPTCHRNDLLEKCLERLAPAVQTLPASRYEVVVTDDGARSTAQEMVTRSFPWARWEAGPRRGPAANRNAGAHHARGEWLVFTDDDCLPAPGWLDAFARALRPGCDAYEGKTTCEAGLRSPLEHAPINDRGGMFWSCNIAIRRERFRDLGGFDESFPHPHMEDVDLRERLRGTGERIVFVEDAVVDHPPRPAVRGKKRALHQESEYLFYYKSGHRNPFLPISLRKHTLGTLNSLRGYPFQIDTVKSVALLAGELILIAARAPRWQREYATRFRETAVAYPEDMDRRLHYR